MSMTRNGVEITPTLRVWTPGLERGTVLGPIGYLPDWFEVEVDGAVVVLDGSRMSTRHPITGTRA